MGGSTATLSVGAIALSTLALLATALVATWMSGWYEERARRALAAVRRGARLRPGFGAVHGTARPLDGRAGHDGGDPHTPGPAGGLLAHTTFTQVRFGGGAWRDAGRVTTGSPFAVVLEGGEEIEVDPRGGVVEGRADSVQGSAFSRDIVFLVSTGDEVWATGVLSPEQPHGGGAYRSGVARRLLTAPRRGPVTISHESPVPGWRALAAAHKTGAYFSAAMAFLVHVVLYRQFDAALILRDQLGCDQRLHDPRFLPVAIGGGLMAVLVAIGGWRSRVTQAAGLR